MGLGRKDFGMIIYALGPVGHLEDFDVLDCVCVCR